jgi:site-specific recombinase XerD
MLSEIESFLNWVQMRSPQARTWRDYRCDLALFVSVVSDRDAQDIHPQQIDQFVKVQIDRGYKPATVNRRLAAVVSFYRHLAAEGKALPCPVVPRRHYLREPQRLPRPVNEQELRKFFGAVADVRDRAMFVLMLYCGLRIGEVSTLKLTDLYLGDTPSRMIIHGKGSRERTVYLSSESEKALQAWLAQRPKARDRHVFLSYQHKKLSTTSISKRIQQVCRSSGVDLTAHRLRHTFADHLLSAGMPITSIQKLMGHRFVETTQNYAAANDKQVQADFYKACEKLEGWKLLLTAVQEGNVEERTNNLSEAVQEDSQEPAPPVIQMPARFAHLPAELVGQLEAYRQ